MMLRFGKRTGTRAEVSSGACSDLSQHFVRTIWQCRRPYAVASCAFLTRLLSTTSLFFGYVPLCTDVRLG